MATLEIDPFGFLDFYEHIRSTRKQLLRYKILDKIICDNVCIHHGSPIRIFIAKGTFHNFIVISLPCKNGKTNRIIREKINNPQYEFLRHHSIGVV